MPPRVPLPRLPQPAAAHTFPLLAVVAPMLAAVVAWAITRSPLTLVFASLGPVVALASVGDGWLQRRRTRRTEERRFRAELSTAFEAVAAVHRKERIHADIVTSVGWQESLPARLTVRLGIGAVPSRIELVGESGDPRFAELCGSAARLDDAALFADAGRGIALIGPETLTRAAARAILLQLAKAISPVDCRIEIADDAAAWAWTRELPHETVFSRPSSEMVRRVRLLVGAREVARLTLRQASGPTVEQAGAAADGCVLSVPGSLVRHPDPVSIGPLRPEFLAEAQAQAAAAGLAEFARSQGIPPAGGSLPPEAWLADLVQNEGGEPAHGLAAVFAIGASGPLEVDLVRDGPHAVIGGTTGSGKSELLIAWVLAMADGRRPAEVTFLFVDYKGGAAFDGLRELRHGVGVITDLDGGEVLRALASLRAEVGFRERALALAGIRSIDEAEPGGVFPRLVLVVDEYAAMLDEHPELASLFTDLAARGRSLGIHLLLCTQRPTGVIRDGILANVGLRIGLRMTAPADSVALLASDAASRLAGDPVGRALVSKAGAPPERVQVAQARPADIARVVQRWGAEPQPRRPWLDPLPAVVSARDLALVGVPSGIPFALVDLPGEQRRAAAAFQPRRDGHLLVVGGAGCGKTAVLDALAAAAGEFEVRSPPRGLAGTWDIVADCLRATPTSTSTSTSTSAVPVLPRLLLLDDLDAVLASAGDEYAAALVDRLARLLREGASRGVFLAIAAQRISGGVQQLAPLCGPPLLLRMPTRQEHLLAGGEAADFDPSLPPGGGVWRGARLQVVRCAPADAAPAPVSVEVDLGQRESFAIVTSRPTELADRILAARPSAVIRQLGGEVGDPRSLFVGRGGPAELVIGDADAWQAHWGAFAAVRASVSVLFDACSVAEYRQLTRSRELPPPPEDGAVAQWLLAGIATPQRARIVGLSS